MLSPKLISSSATSLIKYLLKDDFITDRSAGSVNGTAAEPGPGGNRLVTDSGRISISGGELVIASGGTYNNPILSWGAQTKTVGLAIGFSIMQTDSSAGLIADFGWDDNNSADLREHVFYISAGVIYARDGNRFSTTYNVNIGTFSPLTLYNLVLIILDTQIVWCIKGGSYANWTMLHKATRAAGAPTTLYPALNTYNRAALVKEAAIAVLPVWKSGDSVVNSLSDGNALPGNLAAVLNNFLSYDTRVTSNNLLGDFSMNGSYVGVTKDGNDYYFHIDLGNSEQWRLKFEKLANHPINAITLSQIWSNGTKTEDFSESGSVWEYAYNSPISGAQIGNGHGNDTQTSVSFYLDNNSVTPSSTLQIGNELRVVRVSDLDDGTNVIGTVTTTYTMTPTTGLTLEVVFDWVNQPGSTPSGFVGMWPFTERFNRAYLVGLDVAWNLSANNYTDSLTSSTLATSAVLVWESSGNWAQCQFRNSAISTYVQDRQDLGKIYPSQSPTLEAGYIQTAIPLNYRISRINPAKFNELKVISPI